MHRALGIVEVVEMICEELGPEPGLSSRKRHARRSDLARLARASSTFLNPALNVLWRHQGTILNLLKCMPSDVWDFTVSKLDEDDTSDEEDDILSLVAVLQRLPTRADFDRCLFYCHRVKSFDADEEHFLEPSHVTSSGAPCADPHSFHFVRLFIAARITQIRITCDYSDEDLSETFQMLSSRCSNLKNVGFYGQPAPGLSEFVCSLHGLERLGASGLDPTALSHLARLPTLHSLSLGCNPPIIFFPPSSDRCIPFPALKFLTYRSIELAPRLFEFLIKCSLVELTIFDPAVSTQAIARQFYSALATHCSHSSLEKITVMKGYGKISKSQRDMYLIGGEILRPLFAFTNLVDVSLSHPVGVDLDDIVVREMACAWPRIKFLALSPERSHRIHPRVTLQGIYAFAQHCPRLCVLHLAFDATVVPKIRVKAKERACQRSLHEINVAHSPIRKSSSVAKFLSEIFPELDTITTLHSQIMEWRFDAKLATFDEIWSKVEQWLW
ncbi:hypothetical protein MSAN_00548300 [Mycena sanguinolenta]|uniref:Uncharacterized protein n=1 Tax=Mycena sanguinolenta TaxID=230812 RepID=A0A8H6Z9N8_9AGAR|nr:hypothetical protein MSAN_00548300 [Mycena sanguinolenta]